MKIDIEALRTDLKAAVDGCRNGKARVVEAQRALSFCPKDTDYKERYRLCRAIDAARGEASSAALAVTRRCVLLAHLRGREHLTKNSSLLPFAKKWIEEMATEYALKDEVEETVDATKPAA